MTVQDHPRVRNTPVYHTCDNVIDLSGSALHVFRFDTSLPEVYNYFADIPMILHLLPDTLDVQAYCKDCYRLIVGASDGMGHSMSAVFDLHANCTKENCICLEPVNNGPNMKQKGIVFGGNLWAEAVFKPDSKGTTVDYHLEIAMSIPLPGLLSKMPHSFLQSLGERGMAMKMSHMIEGFAKDIESHFTRKTNCHCHRRTVIAN